MRPPEKRPPGPRQKFPFQHSIAFGRDMLGFFSRISYRYGDVALVRIGPERVYLFNHPDFIKDMLVTQARCFEKDRVMKRAKPVVGEGLLTSEGELHLRQRRLIQPAFHRQRIASYAATMVECAARQMESWRDGETRDIHDELMRLTLEIVTKVLFSANVEEDAERVGRALKVFMDSIAVVLLPQYELIRRLPLPVIRRMEAARVEVHEVVDRIIAARRASGEDRGDLLSMLLRAQDTEGDGGGMSDEQVRDECLTLMLAGSETTANALMWTWYLLSQHSEVVAKLQSELNRVLGGRLPTAEDYSRLIYAEQIVTEAMRVYPPAWGISRIVAEECEIGGFTIRKGTIALVSQWTTHHDARFFPEPWKFSPERWTPDFRASLPKFAYFPFGGGPRQCIGDGFAWMETVLLLATQAQSWTMTLAKGQRIKLQPAITLRSKYGMRMVLRRRSPTPSSAAGKFSEVVGERKAA